MEIKFENYLSDREIKEILEDELRTQVRQHFKNEENAKRLISNLAYEMVYQEVDKILPNYHEEFVAKVAEMINKPSSFNLFNFDYITGAPKSEGAKIIVQTVKENKELIKQTVIDSIKNRDYSEDAWSKFENLAEDFTSNIYEFMDAIKK